MEIGLFALLFLGLGGLLLGRFAFSLGSLGFLLSLGGLFGGISHLGLLELGGVIDPLEVSHRGAVAETGTELDDARVASLAVGGGGRDLGEEFLHDVLMLEVGDRDAAGMEITLLAEGDHALGERLGRLGFCEGGLDAAVLDQAAYLIREKRIAVCLATAELDGFFTVTHGM